MLILPPSPKFPHRPSHATAYTDIVRRSRLSSSSAVFLLVAASVEGICAGRMLKTLLDADGILHTLLPISGFAELSERAEEMANNLEIHTVFLIGLGSILAISEVLPLSSKTQIHIIDSHRPWNLENAFGGRGVDSAAIWVWDDERDKRLNDVSKSWHAMEFVDSDDDSDSDDDQSSIYETDQASDDEHSQRPIKRRRKQNKQSAAKREDRLSREQKEMHNNRIIKYYSNGAWSATPITTTLYAVAISLYRADNSLLWLAILGVTAQYTSNLINRDDYDAAYVLLKDEVVRLNLPSSDNVDNNTIAPIDDLNLPLLKHWSLYSAMIHSNYVAGKLGVWKEGGKKQLSVFLAEMGIPLDQAKQSYLHMDSDLKSSLLEKMADIGPRHGLSDLVYPSFVHNYGYRTSPLSPSDAVQSVDALLQAATGVRVDVELPGGQGGGEWFGGRKIWSVPIMTVDGVADQSNNIANSTTNGNGIANQSKKNTVNDQSYDYTFVAENPDTSVPGAQEPVQDRQVLLAQDRARENINFWHAFDAANPKAHKFLDLTLPLSKALHEIILRQGSLLIDNKAFKTFSNFRMAVIRDGPDVSFFTHSNCLVRLGRWIIDALRDVLSKKVKKKGDDVQIQELPFVIACLDEPKGVFVVAGVTGSSELGDVRKNKLGLAFADASEATHARTRQDRFDAAIVEVLVEDFKFFIEGVQEVLAA